VLAAGVPRLFEFEALVDAAARDKDRVGPPSFKNTSGKRSASVNGDDARP
jgi:hypothetical protein